MKAKTWLLAASILLTACSTNTSSLPASCEAAAEQGWSHEQFLHDWRQAGSPNGYDHDEDGVPCEDLPPATTTAATVPDDG